jgi:hypothetical protein
MRHLAAALLMFSSALLWQTYTISTFAGGRIRNRLAIRRAGVHRDSRCAQMRR